MPSHLLALLVFSALVAVVLACLARDGPRERVRYGARVFAALVLSVALLGWLMSPLPS